MKAAALFVFLCLLAPAAIARHACVFETQRVNSACSADKCSPNCESAHTALYNCRISFGMTAKAHKKADHCEARAAKGLGGDAQHLNVPEAGSLNAMAPAR